jgi:5-methylcytosine-specific restriction endonuclease McrA
MSSLHSPVLVLNKHWAPVRVVPARSALVYLVRGIAEAIDADGQSFPSYDLASWRELSALRAAFEPEKHAFVRGVRDAIVVPAVVRLRKFDKHRRARVRFTRRNIYGRDGNTCQYCGRKFPPSELNLDHVVPRSRGGGATWENIVCSCVSCNSRKGDRTPREAGMKLIREPQRPRQPFDLPRMRHDSWKHFVDAAYWNVELQE